MKSILNICIFFAGFILGQSVMGQASPVTSRLLVQRVVVVDGKTVLKPAGDGKPGDVLQYDTTYRNKSGAEVQKLLVTVPVPLGTTFIDESALPARALASTNGNSFASIPLSRIIKQADGGVRKELIPIADYRALRWEIGTLPVGGSTMVSLRVRIDSPLAIAPANKP